MEGLRQTATAMAHDGVLTEIACLDLPGSPWLVDAPFPVHALGQPHPLRRVHYAPRLAPWLRAHARDYDVAVIHGLWNYGSIGGWLGLRGGALPYVAMTHGMMDPWFNRAYPLKNAIKQAVWRLAQGRVLRDARAVLFTTEQERVLARQAFGGFSYAERVVAYGTADAPPETTAQHAAFRAALPALGDRRYLLFLSRIHVKKGCDLLLQAFAEQAGDHPELDVVMAGPAAPEIRAELGALAASLGVGDRVHWPGMLAGDAKWGAFRGAEAFMLPSHSENFGIVVAEAAAAGVPLLISDKVNIHSEVSTAGAGLIAPDDAPGTAASLAAFLAMGTDERRAMGERARALFLAKFEIRQAARDLATVLAEAAR